MDADGAVEVDLADSGANRDGDALDDLGGVRPEHVRADVDSDRPAALPPGVTAWAWAEG